jgi:hypothetical protein
MILYQLLDKAVMTCKVLPMYFAGSNSGGRQACQALHVKTAQKRGCQIPTFPLSESRMRPQVLIIWLRHSKSSAMSLGPLPRLFFLSDKSCWMQRWSILSDSISSLPSSPINCKTHDKHIYTARATLAILWEHNLLQNYSTVNWHCLQCVEA